MPGWTCDECGEVKFKPCNSEDASGEFRCAMPFGHSDSHCGHTSPNGTIACWMDGETAEIFP